MHYNTGYHAEAVSLMRHFVEVFRRRRNDLRSVGILRGDDARSFPENGGGAGEPAVTDGS